MIPLAVLLDLADWVQRRRASSCGDPSCPSNATADPPRAQTLTRPPSRLWERLPDDDRRHDLRVLGRLIAQLAPRGTGGDSR